MKLENIKNRCEVDLNGCWNWIGATASGYGRLKINGIMHSAHRLAFQLKNPSVDTDGKDVCHHCDNRRCCNPEHLFCGTRSENMTDCRNKKRLASQNGKHVKPKHGPEFTCSIREMKSKGLPKRSIAKLLGWGWAMYQRYEKRYGL